MTNKVLLKRSGTANSAPSAGNLLYGELALNYNDGSLYYLNSSNVVTVIASNQTISLSGNVTAGNFIGNGAQLTGISSIANGNSNVKIATANGNVTIAAGGFANSATFDNLGNITAGHWLVGNGLRIFGDQVDENYSVIITGNIQANLMTMSELFVTDAHIQGTLGNYFGGNLSVVSNIQGTNFFGTGNITTSGGVISAQGNITSSSNVVASGNIISSGNITGTYFIGNGSQLTGLTSSGNAISNGTSNVAIPASNGNVQVAVNSVANSVVMGAGSLFVQGPISTPKVINTLALVPDDVNAVMISPLTVSASGNIFVPDGSTLTIFTPT